MRYIATDLDDTLLYPIDKKNFVCEKNREVIKKFDGILIASGRNCEFIKKVCKELNVAENFVAYNGACVYKEGKEIYKKCLDKDAANKIVNYVKEHFTNYSIVFLTDDNKIYTLNTDDDKRQKEEEERVKNTPNLGYISIKNKSEIQQILDNETGLMKLNVVLNKEDKIEMCRQLRDSKLPITFSSCKIAIEIISSDTNKGKALEILSRELKIKNEEIFAIGDDNNDLSMFDYFENSFLIKDEKYSYYKENYKHVVSEFADLSNINEYHLHPSNFTFYHLVKYYIELTEALEYTLITYTYQQEELIERFEFLKDEYKKGFFHKIVKRLYKFPNEMCEEIKSFIKNYNYKKVYNMVSEPNLHSRIVYNRDLYLAISNSLEIINLCLENEDIKKGLDSSLLELIETTTKHFDLFYLFNMLTLYVSSKTNLLQGGIVYELDEDDKSLLSSLISSLEDSSIDKKLIKEANKLLKENKKFDEEDAYETLNKISIECIKEEKNLYSDFDSFTSKLEKEIENLNK